MNQKAGGWKWKDRKMNDREREREIEKEEGMRRSEILSEKLYCVCVCVREIESDRKGGEMI